MDDDDDGDDGDDGGERSGPMGGLGGPRLVGIGAVVVGTGIRAGLGPSTGGNVEVGDAMGLVVVGFEITVGRATGALLGSVTGVSVTSLKVGRTVGEEEETSTVGSTDSVSAGGVGAIESFSVTLALGATLLLVEADTVGLVVMFVGFKIPVGETVTLVVVVVVGRKVVEGENSSVGPAEISLVWETLGVMDGELLVLAKICCVEGNGDGLALNVEFELGAALVDGANVPLLVGREKVGTKLGAVLLEGASVELVVREGAALVLGASLIEGANDELVAFIKEEEDGAALVVGALLMEGANVALLVREGAALALGTALIEGANDELVALINEDGAALVDGAKVLVLFCEGGSLILGEILDDGVVVGVAVLVGAKLIEGGTVVDGVKVLLGTNVTDGDNDGFWEGRLDGVSCSRSVGCSEGDGEGSWLVLGDSLTDGWDEGLDDGCREVDGACEGRVDGERDGRWDGLVEGSALLDGNWERDGPTEGII
jgi:hypothetical protein